MRGVSLFVVAITLPAFVLVVGVLQPALLEGGPQGMIHLARFKDFGDSVPEALLAMAAFPAKTFMMFFGAELKQQTWLFTLGAYGFLPLCAPEAFVLMLPNLMERFLSDKREMWGLGFHYSVVWVSLSAYASLLAVDRVGKCLRRLPVILNQKQAQKTLSFTVALWLLFCWAGSLQYAPRSFEFKSLQKNYFSTPAQIEINKKALLQIPDDAPVVAQNHFLPFLAFRQFVWQPQDKFFPKATFAILNPTESAWPHSKKHIRRWLTRLWRDPDWVLVFSEGTTVVFEKKGKNPVSPDLALLKVMPNLKKAP